MNLLLGVTSSIAAVRAIDLASRFRKSGHAVRVVMTQNATQLIQPAAFEAITGHRVVTTLWGGGHEGEMDHLDLTKWADVFAIVPATANALGVLAHGLAPDALGTFAVAWNKSPLLLAPAMNPEMWRNAAVQANVSTLRARGHRFVGPVVGEVACGDFGAGRLAPVEEIEAAILELAPRETTGAPLASARPLAGRTVLITSGPTREFADDVRFISNPSSGRMGMELARAARNAGARVHLVTGPTEQPIPDGLASVSRIESAEQMLSEVVVRLPEADAVVFAAAVSDWRPAVRQAGKLKKEAMSSSAMALELVRTPDIALEAGKHRRAGQVFLGFAAESQDLETNANAKLHRKGFDLLFANPVGKPGAGFGSETNRGTLFWADGRREDVSPRGKDQLARELVAALAAALTAAKAGA